jgi:hypothetical protein
MNNTPEELKEMGWNDVVGNLRRAYKATPEQKKDHCRGLLDGTIPIPNSTPEYWQGVKDAAQAFLDDKDMAFKGSESVIAHMEDQCRIPS